MKMHSLRDPIAEAAAAGLKEGGRAVLREARERAPEDDGTLKASGRVAADGLETIVKFTAPHAWLQHERTDYAHPNGGQAKYLEQAALEFPLAEPVARHVRAVIGGG